MHEIQRNLLYQVKKQANKRADPFYNPNSQDDDLRAENNKLRAQLRAQDTQIIRLNSKIDELNSKVSTLSYQLSLSSKSAFTHSQASQQFSHDQSETNQMPGSSLPMVLENRQLQEQNEIMHQENLELNGKNNRLEAELRQLKSDKYQLELRVKQFNILEKMREERFRDEVDRLTPIIIEEPAQFTNLKQVMKQLDKFMREQIVDVAMVLFKIGAKEFQNNKKLNSYTVFKNYWNDLSSKKQYGFHALVACFGSLKKVMKSIDEKYGEFDFDAQAVEDTIDQWVIGSVLEVQAQSVVEGEEERKLFRLLGLKYRAQFPIKGEKHQIDPEVNAHLDYTICKQIKKALAHKSDNSLGNTKKSAASSKQSAK